MHPDRKDDLRQRIQPTAVGEIVQTETTIEGVRVRRTKWKDRRGWVHETHVEAPVDAEGTPQPREDGSYPLTQQATFKAPLGYKITFSCTGQLDFERLDDGTTEVIMIHNHKVAGGTRFNRRHIQMSNEESEPRDFQDWIDRCRAACNPPTSEQPV